MDRYRMFVDEVGNGRMGSFHYESNRRLTLVGLIMPERVAKRELYPRMEQLKSDCFDCHPDDDTVILHRKEIAQYDGAFCALRNTDTRRHFEEGLTSIYNDIDYSGVVVSLDKVKHQQKYQDAAAPPYQYCLEVLLERFVLEMRRQQSIGDVMVESVGKKQDSSLKKAYSTWLSGGTGYGRMNLSPDDIAEALSSRELKLKPKSKNIAGLQMVDLIAKPLERYVITGEKQTGLSDRLATIAYMKLCRSPRGACSGYGIKLL